MQKFSLLLFFLTACASPSLWQLDSVPLYTRLLYHDPTSPSPLRFELIQHGEEITAYLNLTQHRLSACPSLPLKLLIRDEVYEEEHPLLEGRMRLRLSSQLTNKLIEALQNGTSVTLSLDGFEETLRSESFTGFYQQLMRN